MRQGTRIAIAVATGVLMLGACDKVPLVNIPWAETKTPATEVPPGGDQPPPTQVDVSQGPVIPPPTNAETAPPTQDANAGAPPDGTPFGEIPENPNVPISDDVGVVGQDGEPVTLPPPPTEDASGPNVQPTPSPTPSPSPSATTPAPSPSATGTASPSPAPTTPAPSPSTPAPSPSTTAQPANFLYFRPGVLEPGSGVGSSTTTVFAPDIVFPVRVAPAFAQSQVYRYGGSVKGGDQCDTRNFIAPWRDNYCEKRSTDATTPWCSQTGVHLGQDIRVGTPEGCKAEKATKAADRTRYEVVAVEDGIISNVGSYSISVRANSGGRIWRYLHINMKQLKVKSGQAVKKGDLLGYVSNDFGGTPTTLHLHFELKMNTAEHGWKYAPVYSSLLAAYKRRLGSNGEQVADNFAVARTRPR